MTSIAISQPMLFPWPGFFELATQADIYVHLDDAQFSKGSFTNRVQIKTSSGIKWMTIPLAGSGSFRRIMDLKSKDDYWRSGHRSLLIQAIRDSDFSDDALSLFDSCYGEAGLCDLLIASIERVLSYMKQSRPSRFVRASELGVEGSSWQRVRAIVKNLGGTHYITAHGAADYVDHSAFEAEGIEVRYASYSFTPYPQPHGVFTPYVSMLDLIAAAGRNSGSYLRQDSIHWREFLRQKRLSSAT
jgi:hypothetical protein